MHINQTGNAILPGDGASVREITTDADDDAAQRRKQWSPGWIRIRRNKDFTWFQQLRVIRTQDDPRHTFNGAWACTLSEQGAIVSGHFSYRQFDVEGFWRSTACFPTMCNSTFSNLS